jgi:hypothetical protein
VTATPASLNSSLATLISSNYVNSNPATTYTLNFNNFNILPSGSFIQFGVPLSIGVSNTLNCSGKIGNGILISQICTSNLIGQYNYITFSNLLNISIAANTTISLVFNNMFTNYISTAPISNFSILISTNNGYLINTLYSGLSLKMLSPSNFISTNVSSASSINNAINSYTIKLSQIAQFDKDSLLKVYFPLEIIPQSNILCADLTNFTLVCTKSSNIITINLATNTSNTNFGIIISNILNPPSLKPSNQFGF